MSNYPPGVTESHPYFNQPDPPECKCGIEMEWNEFTESWLCFECKEEEVELDAEDIAYLKAEASAEWQEQGGGGL